MVSLVCRLIGYRVAAGFLGIHVFDVFVPRPQYTTVSTSASARVPCFANSMHSKGVGSRLGVDIAGRVIMSETWELRLVIGIRHQQQAIQ